MPTFRDPVRGVSYSQALAEAYASAPDDEIVLDTLEFRHSLFVDGSGNPTAVWVVNDHTELLAYLEAGAVISGGAQVTFQPVRFSFARPSESESGAAPEISVQVDNVARILIPYLDLVKESKELVTLTWRQYLANDLTAPHIDPPVALTVTSVQADMNSVALRAGFADLTNRRFPGREYTARLFPGLVAR